MKRAARVGVTGKIASGKSTLAAMMRESGIEMIDTDLLAKELMVTDNEVRSAIVDLLGEQAYNAQGLNREFVAREIFGNDDKRFALEAIVHPAVTEELERRFSEAPAGSIVGAESALILQTDLPLIFDYIVLVDATDDVVLNRIKNAGKQEEADARQRLEDQAYASIRRDEVDITIQNSGSREEFEKRATAVVVLLKALSNRDLPEMPLHAIEEEEPIDNDESSPDSVDELAN